MSIISHKEYRGLASASPCIQRQRYKDVKKKKLHKKDLTKGLKPEINLSYSVFKIKIIVAGVFVGMNDNKML